MTGATISVNRSPPMSGAILGTRSIIPSFPVIFACRKRRPMACRCWSTTSAARVRRPICSSRRKCGLMNSPRRQSLGRGLAALFGEAEGRATEGTGSVREVAIELIRPGAFQPRRHFSEDELEALARSVREKGVLQPLLVRPVDEAEASFELIAGERRWRAAQRAGLHLVPVLIRPLSDVEALEIALIENLQREDLTVLE